jgi:hypothetical protein
MRSIRSELGKRYADGKLDDGENPRQPQQPLWPKNHKAMASSCHE